MPRCLRAPSVFWANLSSLLPLTCGAVSLCPDIGEEDLEHTRNIARRIYRSGGSDNLAPQGHVAKKAREKTVRMEIELKLRVSLEYKYNWDSSPLKITEIVVKFSVSKSGSLPERK